MTLDDVRAAIDEVDDTLLELLARRGDLVRAAWAVKAEAGHALVDPAREAQILERLQTEGALLGLDPADVERVFREILRLRTR